jgi:hypothetical protein
LKNYTSLTHLFISSASRSIEPLSLCSHIYGSLREIWDSVKSLKNGLQAIEVDLAKNYATKQDINSRLDKIDSVLERIFDRLDGKADK